MRNRIISILCIIFLLSSIFINSIVLAYSADEAPLLPEQRYYRFNYK